MGRRGFGCCQGAILVAALLAVLVPASPAVASPTATDTLRRLVAEANRIITAPLTEEDPLAERLAAIRKLLDTAFAFREAAAVALGREWQARTSAEQEQFVRLFADLLLTSYVRQVASAARLDVGVRVQYLGEEGDREMAIVRTALVGRGGGEMPLDYAMVQRREGWTIRDVLVQGVSLIANYRAQFQRIIRDSSYPGLVARMQARINGWVSSPAEDSDGPEPGATFLASSWSRSLLGQAP
jgi:phospholipid transport system substrate-binding protein